LTALIVASGGWFIAWRTWHQTGREWPDQTGGAISRSRFMAVGGLMISAMFIILILAQGITNLILGACQ
jgi:hypothetical protein